MPPKSGDLVTTVLTVSRIDHTFQKLPKVIKHKIVVVFRTVCNVFRRIRNQMRDLNAQMGNQSSISKCKTRNFSATRADSEISTCVHSDEDIGP